MFEFLLDNSINEFDPQFDDSFRAAVASRRKNIADLLISQGFFTEQNVTEETWNKYASL